MAHQQFLASWPSCMDSSPAAKSFWRRLGHVGQSYDGAMLALSQSETGHRGAMLRPWFILRPPRLAQASKCMLTCKLTCVNAHTIFWPSRNPFRDVFAKMRHTWMRKNLSFSTVLGHRFRSYIVSSPLTHFRTPFSPKHSMESPHFCTPAW